MEEIQQFIEKSVVETAGNLTYMDICMAFNGINCIDAQKELQHFANNHEEYKTLNILSIILIIIMMKDFQVC